MQDKLKILFATDFSKGSKVALKTIKLLQNKFSTEIYLLSVVESALGNWLRSGLYYKEAVKRLQSWKRQIKPSANNKKSFVEIGNPAEIILQVAKKNKIDLILLGDRARDASSRYQTGHTIESVVRFANKPVWICKHSKIKSILCGVDGSSHSKKSLKYAIDLAQRYKAKLTLIHAMPSYLPPFGMSERIIKQEEEKFKEDIKKKINKFIKVFDFSGIKHEILFQWGIPGNVLLDHAEDFDVDLIVIGAKGHSKLFHLFIGSTAEKIIRYTPSSLLVVR